MTISLKVTGLGENSGISFQTKTLSEDDVKVVKNTIKKMQEAAPRAYFAKSLFMPIRTNSLWNFCSDFFLPSFVNFALKTDSLATQLIAGIFTFSADTITFPLRVVTVIPRWVYNQQYPKESHLMYQLLKRLGAPTQLIDQDAVQVFIDEESQKGHVSENYTVTFAEFPLDAVKLEGGGSYTPSSN